MPKFNVGDNVRILHVDTLGASSKAIGMTGVVTDITSDGNYNVKLEKPIGCFDTWGFSEDELKEEQKMFTKDQLRTGMLVQHKNNEWSVVMLGVEHERSYKDIVVSLGNTRCIELNELSDDLRNIGGNNQWTITKVATVSYIGDIFRSYKSGTPMESISGFKVLWQRESEQQVKLQGIISDLQDKLEQAQEELAKCQ